MLKPGRRRKAETPEKPVLPKTRNRPMPASTELHAQIAGRAYELFLGRGCRHGDDWADWFRAEAEVLEKMDRSAGPSRKQPRRSG
jgi:hypothetical protein